MKHLTCAETAKLVRKALKVSFSNVKFSVRSKTYSGGASIDIEWTDGPTTKQVDQVVGIFAGADFDGMVDCKYYSEHWLMPDGSVSIARSAGAHGYTPEEFDAPSPKAERVSMGADFIFCNRHNTAEFTELVGRDYSQKMGWEMPEIYPSGGFKVDYTKTVPGAKDQPLADWFNRKLWATAEGDVKKETAPRSYNFSGIMIPA